MKKMFLIFSHKLTEEQITDAKTTLNVNQFIYLDDKLQTLWSGIPTDLNDLSDYLKDIKDFLYNSANKDDIVLIQGDFGAVYHIVNFSKSLGLKTVYSTTKRVIEEQIIDNQTIKKSLFQHKKFREYQN